MTMKIKDINNQIMRAKKNMQTPPKNIVSIPANRAISLLEEQIKIAQSFLESTDQFNNNKYLTWETSVEAILNKSFEDSKKAENFKYQQGQVPLIMGGNERQKKEHYNSEIEAKIAVLNSFIYELNISIESNEIKKEILQSADDNFSKEESQNIFVAMPFDDKYTDEWTAVSRAVKNVELIPIRMDKIHTSELVIDEIEKQIKAAKVIIVDLSTHNFNVGWEAGFARAMKKRIIYVARVGVEYPFDVRGWQIQNYKNCTELEQNLTNILRSI